MALEKFGSKVKKGAPNECWPWLGNMDKKGYGRVGIRSLPQCGRGAHQVAYVLSHAMQPIPDGINVCHSCDNPPCCNPEHLFLGTQQANLDDAKSKGRMPKGEANGQAKLRKDDVREIIRMKRSGERSAAIALRFPAVTRGHINRLVAGHSWAHLGRD